MRRLVALDLAGGEAFVQALRAVHDAGDAAFVLDRRLPEHAAERLLSALAPAAVLDAHGEHARPGGRPVEEGDALVVATSGTTGVPKGVVLTHDAIAASAVATSTRLGVDPSGDRWLACLPLAHIGGLSVVLRALHTKTDLEVHDGFAPGAALDVARRGATLVSLVPTALYRLGDGAAAFRRVVLGGAAPPQVLPANATCTYGLTETGSGVVYDGVALEGVEVGIGADGEIALRGPMLLRAYRDGSDPKDRDGWLHTADAGTVDGDGRLAVLGRLDDCVVSGGEKIWPEAVEQVLLSHEGVAEAATTGISDPEWGSRLVALVVPAPGATPSLAELRELVAHNLGSIAAPKELFLLERLPRTAIGKLARAEVHRLAEQKKRAMNRLAHETSPYLRQHADNPVDWYPFGEEALRRAESLERPLFVSIGYASCHWCHVMAHESFEDETVAEALNAAFVAIKVDREERPDVDAIYMEAVQAQTGGGGWPMSVFCTPDGRPFYAGTYFPPRRRPGLPSFSEVLAAVADAWATRREELVAHAGDLTAAVAARLAPAAASGETASAKEAVRRALFAFADRYDPLYGGIGSAPKFPQAPMLELLLAAGRLGVEPTEPPAASMLATTLGAMAAGGIYDHLGGGFHRYSTDRLWLVPHFEKMLYDQAALARLYLHAHLATGEESWAQVATETLEYVLRDLAGPDGGFCSSEDADSEGEEGRFYLWRRDELEEIVGADAAEVMAFYRADGAPNFEGRYILHRPDGAPLSRPVAIEAARRRLFAARERRVRPGRDDKVLTEWNAMTIAALAEAGAALERPHYLEAAAAAAEFLTSVLRRDDGRWLRSYTAGRAGNLGLASDYAWLVEGFVRLAEATGEARHLAEARRCADGLIELFAAPDGGIYLTGDDAPALIVRPRDSYDGVVPSATSVAAFSLARLAELTGIGRYRERAEEILAASAAGLGAEPLAHTHLALAALVFERGILEVAAPGRADLAAACLERYLPEAVVAWGERTDSPLFEGRPDGLAYVCRGGICLAPVDDVESLLSALAEFAAP